MRETRQDVPSASENSFACHLCEMCMWKIFHVVISAGLIARLRNKTEK